MNALGVVGCVLIGWAVWLLVEAVTAPTVGGVRR